MSKECAWPTTCVWSDVNMTCVRVAKEKYPSVTRTGSPAKESTAPHASQREGRARTPATGRAMRITLVSTDTEKS